MKLFIIIGKFIIGVMLLPMVAAAGITFYKHLSVYPDLYFETFVTGAICFLVVFLFFYQFWRAYEFGQGLISSLFQMLPSIKKFIARLFPFYMMVIMVFFYLTKGAARINVFDTYFMFLMGFSFAMHILLTAQVMQDEEKSAIKPEYLFWMSVVFIFNVVVTIYFLDFVSNKSTSATFLNLFMIFARRTYAQVFQGLIPFL